MLLKGDLTMKNTIAMMNALKYYNEKELENNEVYKEKLAKDIDVNTYNKMIEKMRSKRALQSGMLSNSVAS